MALRFVDSNKIGMQQASKQAGVRMIMVEPAVHPAQKQPLKITFCKNATNLKSEKQEKREKERGVAGSATAGEKERERRERETAGEKEGERA